MFTQKIIQIPRTYENLDQMPGTSQKIDNTENASTKKEAESKPPIDYSQTLKDMKAKVSFLEKTDKNALNLTPENNLIKNINLGYIPLDTKTKPNNLINPNPTNLLTTVPVASEKVSPVVEAPKKTEHIVQKGDTLGRIALDNKMSLAALLQLNNHISNPDNIKIGDKINLTSSESVASTDKLKNKQQKQQM